MHPALPDFSAARLLVAGDVMLDRYWHGPTSRISPEAPVPVVKVEQDEVRAGGAGNVALNLTALGARASLLGLVGEDEAARLLAERLRAGKIEDALVAAPGHPTITKLRVISRHQQLIRLDFEDRFVPEQARLLAPAFAAALPGAGAVILSDYAKGSLSAVAELIALARARALPVVVDPKGTDFAGYRGATVLTPNLSEFEAVAGPCPDEASLLARGEALREALELEALLITRSERGVTLLQRACPPLTLPARAREVFDVTGAGDTVVAVLGAALACGAPLADATALANLAAGIVVAKLGTATVSVAELQAALDEHAPLPRGRVAAEELLPLCRRSRAAGERLVVALAPPEVLDAAALAWLEAAAARGDRLLLLPPPGRLAACPALAALRSVDWAREVAPAELDALLLALAPDLILHPEGAAPGLRPETLAALARIEPLAAGAAQ